MRAQAWSAYHRAAARHLRPLLCQRRSAIWFLRNWVHLLAPEEGESVSVHSERHLDGHRSSNPSRPSHNGMAGLAQVSPPYRVLSTRWRSADNGDRLSCALAAGLGHPEEMRRTTTLIGEARKSYLGVTGPSLKSGLPSGKFANRYALAHKRRIEPFIETK